MVDPLGAQLVAELHKRVDTEMGGHRVGRLSRRLVTDAAGLRFRVGGHDVVGVRTGDRKGLNALVERAVNAHMQDALFRIGDGILGVGGEGAVGGLLGFAVAGHAPPVARLLVAAEDEAHPLAGREAAVRDRLHRVEGGHGRAIVVAGAAP